MAHPNIAINKVRFLAALKYLGLAVAGIVVLAVLFRLLGPAVRSSFSLGGGIGGSAVQTNSMGLALSKSAGLDMGMEMASDSVGLSARNVVSAGTPSPAPIVPPGQPDGTVGDDAEDYEVTSYAAQIETRDLEGDCAAIKALKGYDYVVFQRADEYEHGCSFSFKVEADRADEILKVIEGLDPKDLSKDTQTIQRLVEDFTSEMDILKEKLETIDQTLSDATEAYDQISRVATQSRDAESLSKIIDSKIKIVEQLTSQRISVSAQLDRLQRSLALQLDRIDFTYFQVTVVEDKFVDGQRLIDSWKAAVKDFVNDLSQLGQDVTIRLVSLLLHILLYVLYALIAVVVVKYGWKAAKAIWRH